MSGTVAFDYQGWIARFPEFQGIAPATVAAYAAEASALFSLSRESNAARRAMLNNLLVAHLAALYGPQSSDVVGRVSGVTQGSVSVQTDYQVPGSAAWFAQTKYGAQFWQASANLRSFLYIAPPALAINGARRW